MSSFQKAIDDCNENHILKILAEWGAAVKPKEATVRTKEGNKLLRRIKSERSKLLSRRTRMGKIDVLKHFHDLREEFRHYSRKEISDELSAVFFLTGGRKPSAKLGDKLICLSLYAIVRYCSKMKLTPPPIIKNSKSAILAFTCLVAYCLGTTRPAGTFKRITKIYHNFTDEKTRDGWIKKLNALNNNEKRAKKSKGRKSIVLVINTMINIRTRITYVTSQERMAVSATNMIFDRRIFLPNIPGTHIIEPADGIQIKMSPDDAYEVYKNATIDKELNEDEDEDEEQYDKNEDEDEDDEQNEVEDDEQDEANGVEVHDDEDYDRIARSKKCVARDDAGPTNQKRSSQQTLAKLPVPPPVYQPPNSGCRPLTRRFLKSLQDITYLSDDDLTKSGLIHIGTENQCPYCDGALPKQMSKRLATALNKIDVEEATNIRRARVASNERRTRNAEGSLTREIEGENSDPTRILSVFDEHEFCRMHFEEISTVPNGLSQSYPSNIDFSQLESRVKEMEDELKGIIERKMPSTFLNEALREINVLGTRNPIVVFANILNTRPGYYGSKGSAELSRIFSKLFVETNILTKVSASPLKLHEYIEKVLVPEAGMRLIAKDLSIQPEAAQNVMLESVEFGNYVHDIQVYEEPGQALLI
ncbi:hypothetical protein BGZ46_002322 [Entomortierella lignicola]|nr:hypothetical protein BGZ46_002322 [Entomortierella lignicola]